jgi:hypothetical protein
LNRLRRACWRQGRGSELTGKRESLTVLGIGRTETQGEATIASTDSKLARNTR